MKGNTGITKTIHEKLYKLDFSDLTQGCKTYYEFIEKIKEISEIDLNYFGIAIGGTKKLIN